MKPDGKAFDLTQTVFFSPTPQSSGPAFEHVLGTAPLDLAQDRRLQRRTLATAGGRKSADISTPKQDRAGSPRGDRLLPLAGHQARYSR